MYAKLIGTLISLILVVVLALKIFVHTSNDALLRISTENGIAPLVRVLLYMGADIHVDHDSVLNLAGMNDHVATMRVLIDHGAVRGQNSAYFTHAVRSGNLKMITLILDHHLFPLTCYSPDMLLAEKEGKQDVITLLHSYEDPNQKCTSDGRRAPTAADNAFADKAGLYQQADAAETHKDYATAASLYKQSADLGFAPAQNDLGLLYAKGLGTETNPSEAIKWLRLSADQKYMPAESNLGYAYLAGLGVEKDYAKALELFQRAATDGSPEATSWIGWLYFNGYGVAQDAATAAKWYQKAADAGDPTGEYELAWLYLNGYGVQRDHETAVKWFTKAYGDGFSPPQQDEKTFSAKPDIFDKISPYEEGPQSRSLWNERVAQHFSAGTEDSYAVLEKWCVAYSQNKTRSADGEWLLDYFLQGFNNYFALVTSKRNSWDEDNKKVQKWLSLYPQSACAPLVGEKLWAQYAWQARGEGYANSVTKEGWKLFFERLRIADKILDDHQSLETVNPVWYLDKINVGLGLQQSKAEMLSIVAKGLRAFPDYFEASLAMETHFLPRWGGSWTDLDAYIQAVVAASDESQKRMMYARLYGHLSKGETTSDGPMYDRPSALFQLTKADWVIIKGGFEDLSKVYPNSAWNLNKFASFACKAGDRQTYALLRSQLKGDRYYSQAWAPKLSMDDCDKNFKIYAPL